VPFPKYGAIPLNKSLVTSATFPESPRAQRARQTGRQFTVLTYMPAKDLHYLEKHIGLLKGLFLVLVSLNHLKHLAAVA